VAAAESFDVARKPLDLCEVLKEQYKEQYFETTRNFGRSSYSQIIASHNVALHIKEQQEGCRVGSPLCDGP
jgi:hypothetical protein